MQLKVMDIDDVAKVKKVLLFTEDKPEDYIFSHLLSLVDDREEDFKILSRAYRQLPESVLTTERDNFFKS